MRRRTNLFLAVIALCFFFNEVHAQQTAKTTSAGTHYLEYLPKDYNSNLNKYPVVISLHGIGEKGNTASDVWKVANVSLAKYIKNGKEYPFIVISPQLKTSHGTWPPSYVMEVVNYVKNKLRVDQNRIYLTGLSLGGFGVWKTAGAYPTTFASILPICSGGNDLGNACKIASANLPVWAFHGDNDGTVSYTVSQKMVNAINSCSPKPNPMAKFTIFPGMGHNIWDKVYNNTDALNWLLSYKKGSSSSTPSNESPVVSAGSDRTITLPTNSLEIQASASDPDGNISSWQWTKIAGGTASLSGTGTSKLKAYNLVAGTYTFRVTVKDNQGASRSDDVNVTVKSSTSSGSNKPPVVSAGADKSTNNNYMTIVGSASDPDGSISSYQWTKVSGGAASLYNTNTSKLFAKNLTGGTYVFRLTVKDNDGAVSSDEMKLYVGSSSEPTPTDPVISDPSNQAPMVYAGTDKSTTNKGFTVVGSASDNDGSIKSLKWTKVSGPSCSMSNTTTLKLWASNLQAGTYVFRLTATDNDGATASDEMKLVVKSSDVSQTTNIPPKVYAGTDKVTTNRGFTVVGKATDEDGSVVSYLWKKLSGPNVPMKNMNTPKLWVYDLIKGTYVFRLMATDNDGATDYDDVSLIVK